MSLFHGALRPPAILSEEAVERYLTAVRAEIEVDPLFRRRLRGRLMNQFVAARESGAITPRRRGMGKLGKAVLYSSFALAATSTSVLAASQEAVPGDVLYGLKRQVERLRADILPAEFQDELAAYELTERIQELSALAERGDSARVAGLAAIVERDYQVFVASTGGTLASDDPQLVVITGLLAALPEQAQDAFDDARRTGPDWSPGQPSAPPGGISGVGPSGAGTNGAHNSSDEDDETDRPAAEETAEPTPKPAKSQKPSPTPEATPEPTPEPAATPLPDPTHANDGARGGGSGDQGSDAQGEDD